MRYGTQGGSTYAFQPKADATPPENFDDIFNRYHMNGVSAGTKNGENVGKEHKKDTKHLGINVGKGSLQIDIYDIC